MLKLHGIPLFAISSLNYIPILKYWEQDFNLEELAKKKNHWYIMCSPLGSNELSKKNANRILKNINKINKVKIKKKNRPSPSESAKEFKVGTKKKGNDGNMWIIVENKNGVKRWNKVK